MIPKSEHRFSEKIMLRQKAVKVSGRDSYCTKPSTA
jgi:hypothetical protein